jgi:hypothetical protein
LSRDSLESYRYAFTELLEVTACPISEMSVLVEFFFSTRNVEWLLNCQNVNENEERLLFCAVRQGFVDPGFSRDDLTNLGGKKIKMEMVAATAMFNTFKMNKEKRK